MSTIDVFTTSLRATASAKVASGASPTNVGFAPATRSLVSAVAIATCLSSLPQSTTVTSSLVVW